MQAMSKCISFRSLKLACPQRIGESMYAATERLRNSTPLRPTVIAIESYAIQAMNFYSSRSGLRPTNREATGRTKKIELICAILICIGTFSSSVGRKY